MFDIPSVGSASQYSSYVLEHLGRFILTNAAPSTSLTSTSGGSGDGSTTTNKPNYILHCCNFQYSERDIG